MKEDQTPIHIGTSGIVLPGNKSSFPSEFTSKTRLQYYSSLFNSLEVNSSFYKTPMPKTFSKWAAETGENFTFSVKLTRAVTHAPGLNISFYDIDLFMAAANQLTAKAGALLIQFPARITIDYAAKVESILQHINGLKENVGWKLAIEIRHTSWHQPQAYALLQKYNASLVFHDMPHSKTPMDHTATDCIYLRFHGPSGDYNGSYSDDVIQAYAKWIYQWHKTGKTVFVYFNNTIGNAYNNAVLLQGNLKRLLSDEPKSSL
jgi:uncharacterized protein YecE (DUF72 family)